MPHRLLFIVLAFVFALIGVSSASAQDAAAQACVPTLPAGWVVYIIQPDDTLSDIAARSGSTVEELQRANCIENPRRIVAGSRLFVPHEPASRPLHLFLRRCLNAGYTTQECRRIWNALHNDPNTFAERCLNAGYTPEQCRRIWNALNLNDDAASNLPERCRSAGLTLEECRRLYNASQNSGDANRDESARRNRERPAKPDTRPQAEAEPTREPESRSTRGG